MSNLLRDVIFWAAVACCAAGSLAILRLTLAAPRPGAVGSSHQLPRSSRTIELAWVVLPMLALAGLLVWTHREMRGAEAHEAAATPAATTHVHETPE